MNNEIYEKSIILLGPSGAGHSYFTDQVIFERVKNKLELFKNIILLLPSNDIKYSLDILNSRNGKKENIILETV